MRSSVCRLLILMVLIFPYARASEMIPPGMYEIITEIVMPHLEENLRYATTREKRCLSHQELASFFPVLGHISLQGCKLDKENRDGGTVSYLLNCASGNETTGGAQWHLDDNQIRGTLAVKLGGKNMTFSQRITAKRVGECVRVRQDSS